MASYSVYSVNQYKFGVKDEPSGRENREPGMEGRLNRMKKEYSEKGTRRT